MPNKVVCPNCGKDLDKVYVARSAELQWDGSKWIEKNVFAEGAYCPDCDEELDDELFIQAGLPAPALC